MDAIHLCMASSEPGWDLYRSFLEVMRTGSLSAAARSLRLTQPTVGRHIASLEQSLGGKVLFTRHRSGLLPTEVAIQLRISPRFSDDGVPEGTCDRPLSIHLDDEEGEHSMEAWVEVKIKRTPQS